MHWTHVFQCDMRMIEGWKAAGIVAVVALAVRLLHLFDLSRLPIFDRPTVDAALYVSFARNFAELGILPDVFFKPPLYPVLLGAWWQFIGEDYLLLRLPGVFLGTFTSVLVWWLARTVFDGRIALVAGLLYALHSHAVYFEVELLEIGLVTCLQTAALLLVLGAAQQKSARNGWIAGMALGLGCLARPTFFPVAFFSLFWLGRRRWRPALFGLLIMLAPITLHNAYRGHDLVLVSANLGVNFYIGNNPMANGRISATPELPAQPAALERQARRIAQTAAGRTLRPSEVSRYWFRKGLDYAISHPAHSIELLARKVFYSLHGAAVSDNEDLGSLHRYLRLQPWLPIGMWLLIPLGLLGMVASRQRSNEVRYLRWCLLLQVIVLLPFFLVERFRLPWAPILAIFAAYALVHGYLLLRHDRRNGIRGVLAFLVLLGLCNLPVWGVLAPLQFDLDYKIAYAWQQKGNRPAAMQAYRQSIEHHPTAALARNALGYMLAEDNTNLEEAVVLIETALRLDPAHTANYSESLAFAHLQRQDAPAALAACSRGLQAPQGGAAVRAALLWRRAQAYRLLGETAPERQALRQALELHPNGPRAPEITARLVELPAP